MKLHQDLIAVLKKDDRLVVDGKLAKNKVIELALQLDADLLKLLRSSKDLSKTFFQQVDDVLIFDKVKFQSFVSNKQFLPDSFTEYKNKIGLSSDKQYLTDNEEVVLAFPYKDCVLEGGQTQEDTKRGEVFWNETLAPDEIDKLLEQKALTNIERIEASKTSSVQEISSTDNLYIKGNNLLVLHSLKKRFQGKVKLIYIDPPYNTDSSEDSFKYNDSFNHSTWLAFMKNRLEVAKDLLSKDGAIYIQLDYNEVHYCKVLMDEIFGRENFQREIIWRIGWISGYKSADKNWIRNHDTILFYSKDKNNLKFNKKYIPYPEDYVRRDGSKPEGNGYPYEDTWNASELDVLNSIAIVSFSKEKVGDFKGQKNEALVQRIIEAHTEKGDIVLDFFSGTGTTASVAHKLGRQWIVCEQMDTQVKKATDRLKKTLKGDQTGISKNVNWNGGGTFVYAELAQANQFFVDKIQDSKDTKELLKVWDEMKEKAFLSYKVKPEEIDNSKKDFEALSFEDQQKFLISTLDKNLLYVPYSEMEDKTYKVSKEDIALNNKFYGRD